MYHLNTSFIKDLPCEVGIKSWAPWMPCTSCPDAKINCGIGAGCCWDVNSGGMFVVWEDARLVGKIGDGSVDPLEAWEVRGVVAMRHKIKLC